jgi:hypothetical protein
MISQEVTMEVKQASVDISQPNLSFQIRQFLLA